MKTIPLSQGKVAIVDDADYEWLSQWKWCAHRTGKKTYAVRRSNERTVLMHRVVLGAEVGDEVDHANGDGLDNRRSNLRFCTRSQNVQNVGLRSTNTSGYKGVSRHRETGKWRARIRVDGKFISLGLYTTKEDAARAYDTAAVEHFGEFAWSNLPQITNTKVEVA